MIDELPPVFVFLVVNLSSGEPFVCRHEFGLGVSIGNGGGHVNFDSSVLDTFCNESLLLF